MKKKGISPLIATVLILGFTVALAAVIMTWGTGFTKKMQETTEETADIQILCATDVLFDIKGACEEAAGTYKLSIANNGNIEIKRFEVRFYKDQNTVKPASYDFGGDGIIAFGLETESKASGFTGENEVKQIEAIPVIEVGGKPITCIQTTDTFGSLVGTAVISDC